MSVDDLVRLQARVYQLLPGWLRAPINDLRVLPSYLGWRLLAKGRQHARSVLGPLANRFQGCRAVVMGNGPSLKKMDLTLLKHEFTFGLNRIYLMFAEMAFQTTFLVSVNRYVIEQFAEEMLASPGLKVFSWKHGRGLLPHEDLVCLPARPFSRMNGRILSGYYNGGGTVTNVALELAYYFGFSEVLLIGVDHSYSRKGLPGKPVESGEEDVDHFSKEYFGKGVVWQLPNFQAMERGYRLVDELFREAGRRVYDGTVDGNLQVFEKVEWKKYLAGSSLMNQRAWNSLKEQEEDDFADSRFHVG